jgi:hypothetical protein
MQRPTGLDLKLLRVGLGQRQYRVAQALGIPRRSSAISRTAVAASTPSKLPRSCKPSANWRSGRRRARPMTAPPDLPPEREPPIEASPFWGLLLVLAEIAERVCRRRAEEYGPNVLDACGTLADRAVDAAQHGDALGVARLTTPPRASRNG